MTAGPLVVHQGPGTAIVDPRTLGVSYAEAQAPQFWRFTGVPNPERSPLHPLFQRYDERSVVAPTDGDVTQWLDAGVDATSTLETLQLPEPSIMVTELPHWRKLTVQRGQLPWYFIHAPGPGRTGRALPAGFLSAMERLMRRYADAWQPIPSKPDPAKTNPGYPSFVTHYVGKVVSNLLGGNDLNPSAFLDAGRTFASMVGIPPEAAWGFGLGNRSGPSYKDRPVLLHKGGSTYAEWGLARGFAQRNRIIYMAAAACNRLLRPLYERLQGARRRLEGLWHAGGISFGPLAGRKYQYEADIAAFDSSVSPELQDLLLFMLKWIWPDLREHAELWRVIEELPFITPSWSLTPGRCGLVGALGGTRSGTKTTAEAGTAYARAATEYALDQQGISLNQVTILSLGDDVRISSDVEINPDAWEYSFNEVGLSCTLIAGDGFLARHLTPTLDGVPIAGRVVQQTMSNEHERKGPEALGLSMLGFIARTEKFEQLPAQLQTQTWSVISHAKWIRDVTATEATSSVHTLRSYLINNPEPQQIINQALKSVEGLDWLSEHTRAAEHSESGRQLLAWITGDIRALQLDRVSRELYVDAASAKLASLPLTLRLQLAVDGYYAVTSSPLEAQRWLTTSLSRHFAMTTPALQPTAQRPT